MPFYSQAWLEAHPEVKARGLSVGWHADTRDELVIPDVDRYAGTYVLGVQGTGKSAFLETLIHQDALAGRSIIVIDPHGDLVNHTLAAMPQHRMAQIFILDMTDEEFPFGVNFVPLVRPATEVARSEAVARIEHLFTVMWAEAMGQQYLPRFVRNITLTLIDNPGSTLVDVFKFIKDPDYRAKLLNNVTDEDVRAFWQREFGRSETDQEHRMGPLIGRLEGLFQGRALVRNILGQRVTSINFRKAIERHEIILVRLPLKKLGTDAQVVGKVLLAQIHAAIFSFENVPEHERPGVSLYVDEFQNFMTGDIEELFTEGRKYGVRLVIAHQFRDKLEQFLKQPVLTARTKVCFQTTDKDASEVSRYFPITNGSLQPEELDPHPVKYLLEHTPDNQAVRTFVNTYLHPVQQAERSNGRILMKRIPTGMFDVALGAHDKDGKPLPVFADDPTPELEKVFREVMRTRDPYVAIPREAVEGFADCGTWSFYREAKSMMNLGYYQPNAGFPPHLGNHTRAGFVWGRRPEDGKEQFLHCLFHIRATMYYLAEHPIGKAAKSTTGDSVQALMTLPKRTMFVRCGQDVTVLYSHRTPAGVEGRDFQARQYFVQQHTRQTYCHPRAQIEQLIGATTPPTPENVTQWNIKRSERVQSDEEATDHHHETEVRHSATGDTGATSGAVSATTADG